MVSYKENYLATVNFEKPEYIPMFFYINPACWDSYPKEALLRMIDEHKLLFPFFD